LVPPGDFSGKFVSVWCKDPAKGGCLENVRVQRLGQRDFLVGRVTEDELGDDWRAGATYWFPVDDILMLIVFETLEAARKAYGSRKWSGG